MTTLNNAETIKECRKAAKSHGLTFKRHANRKNEEGSPLYCYVYRKNQEIARGNLTLSTSFEISCSDELMNYDQ